ncbi:uncharacterized protein LOC114353964 [Ostrinia furnacalis]|uniref:uncharacterized protein LOC114353964 n=1 Tax=Ostrinia furnacalis TaxID=93504 RepID=UPI00103D65BD|nr:uncharacterized protein LOC114353964 [Ostrinia furnacalis]
MSDSEFESTFGGSSTSIIANPRKHTKKRKTAPTSSRSDSECETVQPAALKKKPVASRPRAPTKSSTDLFGLLSDEDESVAIENSQRLKVGRQQLDSSLTSKVANGVVRRTVPLEGAYYVEVRVYNTRDALKTPPADRYKKTLHTLKVQLNTETSQWRDLQKFMKTAKKLFEDREPIFYNNKINFKS